MLKSLFALSFIFLIVSPKVRSAQCSGHGFVQQYRYGRGDICKVGNPKRGGCVDKSFGLMDTIQIIPHADIGSTKSWKFLHCGNCEDVDFKDRLSCFQELEKPLLDFLDVWEPGTLQIPDFQSELYAMANHIQSYRSLSRSLGLTPTAASESFRDLFLQSLRVTIKDKVTRDLDILGQLTRLIPTWGDVLPNVIADIVDPKAVQLLRKKYLENRLYIGMTTVDAITKCEDRAFFTVFRWRPTVPDVFPEATLEELRNVLLDPASVGMGFNTLRVLDLYVRGYMQKFSDQMKVYWSLSVQRSIILLSQAKTAGDIDKIIEDAKKDPQSKFLSDLLVSQADALKADVANSAQLIAELVNKNLKDLQTNMNVNIEELKKSVELVILKLPNNTAGLKAHSALVLGNFDLLTLNGQSLKWKIDDVLANLGTNPRANDAIFFSTILIRQAAKLSLDSFGMINTLEKLNLALASRKEGALNDFLERSYDLGSVFPDYLFDVLERLNGALTKDHVRFESTIKILRDVVKMKMSSFNQSLEGMDKKITEKAKEISDKRIKDKELFDKPQKEKEIQDEIRRRQLSAPRGGGGFGRPGTSPK